MCKSYQMEVRLNPDKFVKVDTCSQMPLYKQSPEHLDVILLSLEPLQTPRRHGKLIINP